LRQPFDPLRIPQKVAPKILDLVALLLTTGDIHLDLQRLALGVDGVDEGEGVGDGEVLSESVREPESTEGREVPNVERVVEDGKNDEIVVGFHATALEDDAEVLELRRESVVVGVGVGDLKIEVADGERLCNEEGRWNRSGNRQAELKDVEIGEKCR
jgi:hypothetical protein